MATFDANIVRACAIELRERALTLFMAINALYQGSNAWVLNGIDPALPEPFEVRSLLEGYKAIKIDSLKLTEWGTQLLQAQPGDTLSYPPPPVLGGAIQFEIIAFTEINF